MKTKKLLIVVIAFIAFAVTTYAQNTLSSPPPIGCGDPHNLTVTATTTSTANLSWNSDGQIIPWEIEVIPATAGPTGMGIVYNGLLPYFVSGLSPATAYVYYVRSSCGFESIWIGPYQFVTLPIVANVQTLCTKTIQPYNVNVGDAAHNGATYVWSISPATPSAIISGNGSNAITVDWTNAPNGTYTLQAIETNAAGCMSTAVSAAINLLGKPIAPVAPATQNFCTASTMANLAATGSNLQWYDVATGGTALTGTAALVTGTTYYVAQTTGTCESTRTAVTVTITTATAPTAVAQTFCSASTVANLVATGTAIQWYAAATGGTALSGTNALISGTTYYASQTVGTCESTRTAVAVSINDAQITANATTVCAGTAVNLTASTTLSSSSVLPTNLQSGLVGYWPFNGNANDTSANGNHGTVNGATLTSDRLGNNNNSYQFIQDNQNIDIGRNTTMARINSDFTISAWIKINQYTSNSYANTIISNRGTIDNTGSCFALVGTINNLNYGKLEYGIGGGGSAACVLSNNVIPLNSWTNVVVTYNYLGSNNNLVKLYINGVLDNSGVLPNTPGPVNQNNYIGDEPFDPANQNFTGNIDDLAVFNRVLSSQEIQQLYTPAPTYLWSTGETTATINPTPTATITYWCDVTTNGLICRKNVTITVTPKTTPTFTTVASSCSNAALTALPTTSNNGISGTWSPALNNTTTTTYTFTPTTGQCANTATQTISITAAKVTSAISFVAPVAALPSVTIGTQVWTNKNLDVETYRDGTPIPQVTDPAAWTALTTGAWCYYNNDPANGAIYGKLYNWYAVAGIHDNDPNTPNKILSPSGWHAPSDAEWTTLTTSLGGESIAGGKMKETGTSHWITPNQDATNSSGFSGLPGGFRDDYGFFGSIGYFNFLWSSSEYISSNAWDRILSYYYATAQRGTDGNKKHAFSVRLVKD